MGFFTSPNFPDEIFPVQIFQVQISSWWKNPRWKNSRWKNPRWKNPRWKNPRRNMFVEMGTRRNGLLLYHWQSHWLTDSLADWLTSPLERQRNKQKIWCSLALSHLLKITFKNAKCCDKTTRLLKSIYRFI